MNHLRIASDLHLEMDPSYRLEKMKDEEHMHLILAGDICVWNYFKEKELWRNAFTNFFEDCQQRFKTVWYIPGNHEYYEDDINTVDAEMKEFFTNNFDNIFLVNNKSTVIEDTRFIFSTLWTYVDEDTALFFRKNMGDYNVIKDGKGILHPEKTNDIHAESVEFILQELQKDEEKKIVITHHLPSRKSVNPRYHNAGPMNYFFYTTLDPLIVEHEPLMWIHGHTHDPCTYMLGNTKIICNPKGYGSPHPNFDPTLTVSF